MPKFTDSKQDEWVLNLDVGMIEDIKEATSVDLDLLLTDPTKLADVFLSTPKKLVEILYVMCEEQVKEKGMMIEVEGKQVPDARAFGKRFDRPTLDKAADAVIAAVVDFYPRSSAGRVIGAELPGMLKKLDEQVSSKAREMMEQSRELLNTATN